MRYLLALFLVMFTLNFAKADDQQNWLLKGYCKDNTYATQSGKMANLPCDGLVVTTILAKDGHTLPFFRFLFEQGQKPFFGFVVGVPQKANGVEYFPVLRLYTALQSDTPTYDKASGNCTVEPSLDKTKEVVCKANFNSELWLEIHFVLTRKGDAL